MSRYGSAGPKSPGGTGGRCYCCYCQQAPVSSCASPTPRETNNYYSRNHGRKTDTCRGSCYCPESCVCPHKGLQGRFASAKSCDPSAKVDCPRCCSPKRSSPPVQCCRPACRSAPARCRPSAPVKREEQYCCSGPYCPPPRKPICYPPVQRCEPNPSERICYYPCPVPSGPKYCTCGSPNPCECDPNRNRQRVVCERAPCCRRCGRKVYVAEKIVASGGAFHTCCFSCYCCHKPLEVTSFYENQGEIYCKQCYSKYFGVQGYGYGLTLQSPL